MRPQTGHGWAVLILGIAVVSLLLPLPNQYRSHWLTKLLDLGHLPLLALVTVGFWLIVRPRIWLAFCLALVFAVAVEVGQEFTGRSGDLLDVVRGLLGALIAAVFLQMSPRPWRWRQAAVRTALAVALAAWPIWDCCPVLLDAFWAYRSFPVLSDFQSPWEGARWYARGACLERDAATEDGQRWQGELKARPNEGGSGAILFPVVRDWSGYRRLCCTFSFSGEPLSILISVRDGRKVETPRKRFDLEHRYRAGRHRVVIDLEDLAAGNQFAPLDISRIQSFHFVVTELAEPRTLFLQQISLE